MKEKPVRIEYIPLSTIQGWPRNPKRHDLESLGASVGRFGFVSPLLLDEKSGRLVAGHGRLDVLRAMKERGEVPPDRVQIKNDEWLVPVVRGMHFASEAEAEAYLLADNQVTIAGGWDEDALAGILAGMAEQGKQALDGLGWSADDIEMMLDGLGEDGEPAEDPEPQINKAEELREKWKTETGQLWRLSDHFVICGDCTDEVTIARLMGSDQFDMMFADPPYGVSYADKNTYLNAISRGNCIQVPIEHDHETVEDMGQLWFDSFSRMLEKAKPGAAYYVTSPQGGELMMMMMMIVKAGWLLKHTLIWVKNNHVLGRCDYNYKHEPILYGWKEGGHKWYATEHQVSVWEIDKPQKSNLHPTTKPIELVEKAVHNSTKRGDLVIDPFLGSGTSLIACERLNRRCRGIEISEAYTAVTLQRFFDMTGKQPELVDHAI